MNWRKVIAGIAAILTFIGVIVLIGIVTRNFWPGFSPSKHPIERLLILFISFMMASFIYNLIKGEEPEGEVKEKREITSKEISKKLEKIRNPEQVKSIDKNRANLDNKIIEIPENQLIEQKSIINDPKDTYLSLSDPERAEAHNTEPQIAKIESKTTSLNEIKIETAKEPNLVFKEKINQGITKNNFQTSNLNHVNLCSHCGGSNVIKAKYCVFCGFEIGVAYASSIVRVLAFLIDGIILFIISLGLMIAITVVFYNSSDDFISLIWIIISLVTVILYFLILEGPLTQGQTFGKMAVSIRVVDQKSFGTISYTKSFIRNILRLLDLMPYFLPYLVGFIAVGISKKNQRIGDIATGTIVIKE